MEVEFPNGKVILVKEIGKEGPYLAFQVLPEQEEQYLRFLKKEFGLEVVAAVDQSKVPNTIPFGLGQDFQLPDDFDEPLDDFKEYYDG